MIPPAAGPSPLGAIRSTACLVKSLSPLAHELNASGHCAAFAPECGCAGTCGKVNKTIYIISSSLQHIIVIGLFAESLIAIGFKKPYMRTVKGLSDTGLHNHMRDLRILFNDIRDFYNDEDQDFIRINCNYLSSFFTNS
jgi:hypothetical protein